MYLLYIMASTSNKNTSGNYRLEQDIFNRSFTHVLDVNFGYSENTCIPGNGFLVSKLPKEKLSQNFTDTESFLRGTNSTNLVNPAPKFVPQNVKNNSIDLFEQEITFIPEPLVLERNQRPMRR